MWIVLLSISRFNYFANWVSTHLRQFTSSTLLSNHQCFLPYSTPGLPYLRGRRIGIRSRWRCRCCLSLSSRPLRPSTEAEDCKWEMCEETTFHPVFKKHNAFNLFFKPILWKKGVRESIIPHLELPKIVITHLLVFYKRKEEDRTALHH